MLTRRPIPKIGAENKIQVYQLRHNMWWEARCNRCFTITRRAWYTGAPRYFMVWRRVLTHAYVYHNVRLDA